MNVADSEIREVIQRSTEGFSIHAAAGSGKTTTVVRRIVERLTAAEHPLPPKAIAAITYTRAAAAELRRRIQEQLVEVAENAADLPRAARAVDALASLQDAHVSTIHGLATDIIRAHAALIDLPPEVEIADETVQGAVREQRWKQVLTRLLSDDRYQSMFECAYELGLVERDFTTIAREIQNIAGFENRTVENARRPEDLGAFVYQPLTTAFEAMAYACRDLEFSVVDGSSELLVVRRIREDAEFWLAHDVESVTNLLAAASSLSKLGSATGKKADWDRLWPGGYSHKGDLIARRKGAYEDLQSALSKIRGVVLGTVGEVIRSAIAADAEERRQTGFITYDEQISLATQILGHAQCDAADELREIVVDEVQDTDPHAVEFLSVLVDRARAAAARSGDGLAFLIVGDRRQSIYGFRGADPSATASLALHAGDAVELSSNFRSRPELLAWIAQVFASIAPDADPAFGTMQAQREAGHPGKNSVQVLNGVAPSAPDVRMSEYESVADAIQRVRSEARIVGADGASRPIAFGDIAVLLRNRSGLDLLLDVFTSRGIPAFLESGTLRYQVEEVDELIAFLDGVAHPRSLNHVIAALRVPPFACSDFELASCRDELKAFLAQDHVDADLGEEKGSAVAGNPPTVPRPIAAAIALRLLAARWSELPAIEAVHGALNDTAFESMLELRAQPKERALSLRFAVDAAAQAVASNPLAARPVGVGGVAEWLRLQRASAANVADMPTESNMNAVRISTMHGSKGLEYPVVIVCGLGGGTRTSRQRAIGAGEYITLKGGRERTGVFETSGFADARTDLDARASAEELRLAYVAMTRARDRLIVSTWRRPTKSGTSLAQRIAEHLDLADGTNDEALAAAETVHDEHRQIRADSPIAPEQLMGQGAASLWVGNEQPVLEMGQVTPLPPRIGPSRLVHHEMSSGHHSDRFESDRLFGLVIHRCLELSLFEPNIEQLDRVIAETVGARRLDEDRKVEATRLLTAARREEIRACLEAALTSEAFAALTASGVCHHEIGVTSELETSRIRGTIDLLIERDDGLAIFDYKTDPFDPSKPGDLEQRYAPQLGAYVMAVEKAQPRRITECGLVVVNPGLCEVLTVDVQVAKRAALRAIEEKLLSEATKITS